MSKGSTKTTTTQNLADPYVRAQGQALYGQAQQLAKQPFSPYTGQVVAGPNGDYNLGAQQLRDAAASGQNVFGQASQALLGALGQNPGSFLTGNISAYMNPYQQQVIDAGVGDLNRARIQQQQSDAAAASGAGAFGGDRHGIVDAQTNDAYLRNVSNLTAGLRQQGFDTAAGLMNQDYDRALQGRQVDMQGAQALQGLNASQIAAAQSQLGLGQDAMQRQQQQLEFNYNQFLQGQQYPWQMLQNQAQVLGAVPQNTTGVQTDKTQGSTLGAITGLAGIAGSFIPGVGKIAGLLGGGGAQFAGPDSPNAPQMQFIQPRYSAGNYSQPFSQFMAGRAY